MNVKKILTIKQLQDIIRNNEYNRLSYEIKNKLIKKEHIGQVEIYMNYIYKNIKNINHDKTIGIIISKKDNSVL